MRDSAGPSTAWIFKKKRKEIIWKKKLFQNYVLKFIYSEKATKLCEISTLILSYVVPVKSKVEIPQNWLSQNI